MVLKQMVLALAAVAVLGLAAGCETSADHGRRRGWGQPQQQRMLVSEEQVEQGAVEAYNQEKSKAQSEGKLNADSALTTRVRNVSQRLIPGTAVFRPDAVNWKWEINTLTTKELNAYCMPGGKIMVYSGLVEQLKLTDAEMAARHRPRDGARAPRAQSRANLPDDRSAVDHWRRGRRRWCGRCGSGSRKPGGLCDIPVAAYLASRRSEADVIGLELDGSRRLRPERCRQRVEQDDVGGAGRAARVPQHASLAEERASRNCSRRF